MRLCHAVASRVGCCPRKREDRMELNGKVAFITGGGGSIGEGMAEAYAEKDMKLVLADLAQGRAKAEAEKYGERALALELDVTSLDSWSAARERALARFGQVDV